MFDDLARARRGRVTVKRADDGLLETHLQTQQKLEIMVRYWEVWCSILSRAFGHNFCVASLWLIDCFAGRGFHPTNVHPDGFRSGTPMQAYRAAVVTRRRSPRTAIHLRAVDINPRYAQELERRMVMAAPSDANLTPDWAVLAESYNAARPKIIADMAADLKHGHSTGPGLRHHNHRSLWLIDPDGLKDIPHADIEPLEALPGAEVIINLDLGGLLRVKGAAQMALDDGDLDTFRRGIKESNTKRLDLTWGGPSWDDDMKINPMDILGSMAQGYADTFPGFKYRKAYRLRGSKSQRRFLIHLTHSDVAAGRFEAIWKGCFTIDTLAAGDRLNESARAVRAEALHEQFKGTTTGVRELYDMGMGASRFQIRSIFTAAQDGGYGTFDQDRDQMTWNVERDFTMTLGLMDEDV